jgi:hypothetical protein
MRRIALAISLMGATVLPASASAHEGVGAPMTHGPDPAAVAAGPEAQPPSPSLIELDATSGAKVKVNVAAKPLPTRWCGEELTADDTADEVDNGAYRYHAVYMVAADAPDRFTTLATEMQTDAFQASSLLETDYGRAIRYDMGTNCGAQYIDITVVRMQQTSAQMAAAADTPNGTFNAVTDALDAAGFQTIQSGDTFAQAAARTRNYLVWLDAPAPSGTCGQASIYDDPSRAEDNVNNFGGKAAIVFRKDDGFCSSNAARHEMGHNLGALQQVAPHAFDGSHCDDAYEDTMCYSNSPQVAGGQRGTFFDYGNDDYWDPPGAAPLPWWTVNLNRFICPDATCNGSLNQTPGVATSLGTPQPDGDGDGVADDEDNCPDVANADQENNYGDRRGDACERRPRAAHLKMRATRHGKQVWKVRLRATGEGRGVVVVRCRRRRNGQVRTVLMRTTSLPRTLHGRVRCVASRPRAKLLV